MFESFDDFVNNEARDFNDPVLMKMRAAQMKANKKAAEKAAKAAKKGKELSPAKIKKIEKLKAERAEIMRQMELDAGQAGSEWNDDMAQSYGEALNDIDKEIIKLGGNPIGASGFKLTEAYTEDDINMSYGFFRSVLDAVKTEKEAIALFDEGVAQLQRAPYRLTETEALAVLNSPMGRHAADQIVDGEADSAVLGLEQYYGKSLKKEIAKVQRAAVAEEVEEAYDGKMSDFKYEFPLRFAEVTGNPEKAIKKMAKKGKGFEVRTATYMSRQEMEEVGREMDMELVDYKKDRNIAVSVYESKIQLKRKYTENHPAITAGKFAKVRNKMLEAIADGKLTKEEFDTILREMSVDAKRWVRRNNKYFNVSEDGVTLSKFGRRALNQITINENMDNNKFLFESFNDFINSNNTELITEGTRGQFGIIDKNGKITSVYTHYDSYPEYMLPIIKKGYKNASKVKQVIDKGDNSGLETSPRSMRFYGDGRMPSTGTLRNWDAYVKDIRDNGGAEYVYLYNDAEGRWYMANVRSDARNRDLMPIDQYNESVVNEEMSKSEIKKEVKRLKKMGYDAHEFYGDIRVDGVDAPNPNWDGKISLTWSPDGIYADDDQYSGDDQSYNKFLDILEYPEDYNGQFESLEPLCEATVEMDAMAPDDRNFLRWLDKNKVEIIKHDKQGPNNHPVITMQGKRKDLERVLADCKWGWCDEDLAEYIEESLELNEAFKSSKLRSLMNMYPAAGYGKEKNLAKAVYGLSKIKLDQIEDSDLIQTTPKHAYKQFTKERDYLVFYVVDYEKHNPYADISGYGDAQIKPGILGVTRGKDFLGVAYNQSDSRASSDKRGRRIAYTLGKAEDGAVGGNKKYKGYSATGIYNVKRAADLADRVIAIDLSAMGKSSRELIQQRADAQSGAIAFKSDKDFKKANMTRYKDILSSKAAKLPLDKMVEGAINELTKHIADAMKSGEKTKYGEIKIGEDKRGREIKITDAANIMSSILGDYERYVRYTADAEREKDSGYSSGYYEKEAKAYAKKVSDRVKKVKAMDYAW